MCDWVYYVIFLFKYAIIVVFHVNPKNAVINLLLSSSIKQQLGCTKNIAFVLNSTMGREGCFSSRITVCFCGSIQLASACAY